MAFAKRAFTVVLEPDPEQAGYTVLVPALPGCVTEGDTVEEDMAHAKEAIPGYLEALVKEGTPIPEGRVPAGEIAVEISL